MSAPTPIGFDFDPDSHTFTQGGNVVPSVTQVLAEGGLCDFSFVEQELREYAMARGTSVHWMTQLEDEGALDYRRVPKSLRGYRKAWNLWKERSGFQVMAVEYKFISQFGFAGIVDRIGSLPPHRVIGSGLLLPNAIVDLKTGDVADYVRYQLAPYTVAAATQVHHARSIRRIALRLRPDGTYKVKEFPQSQWAADWAKFMDTLRRTNGHRST